MSSEVWLDASYLKVREGRREIVGLGLGPSEAETFWSVLLKGLVRRGPEGDRARGLGRARVLIAANRIVGRLTTSH